MVGKLGGREADVCARGWLTWERGCVFMRQLGNHPLLIRRIFTDETVRKLARKYHKMAVFGNECTVERVQEELNGYSDFTLHRVRSRSREPWFVLVAGRVEIVQRRGVCSGRQLAVSLC